MDATIMHFWPMPKSVLTEVAEFYIKKTQNDDADDQFISQLKSFITET